MNLEDEILINRFGQDLASIESLIDLFRSRSDKREMITELIHLVIQSKATPKDVDLAISKSGLKPTFTPCVLLRKEFNNEKLYRIADLPDNELEKSFILLASLFWVAYRRRFNQEKGNPNKWWYWDLSNPAVIETIKKHAKIF